MAPPLRAPRRQPRTVVVLGGGGMRGMAHIGVLRALERSGADLTTPSSEPRSAPWWGRWPPAGCQTDEMTRIVTQSLQKDDYFRLNFVKFLLKGATRPKSIYRGDKFRERLGDLLPPIGFERDAGPVLLQRGAASQTGGQVFWGTPGLRGHRL